MVGDVVGRFEAAHSKSTYIDFRHRIAIVSSVGYPPIDEGKEGKGCDVWCGYIAEQMVAKEYSSRG